MPVKQQGVDFWDLALALHNAFTRCVQLIGRHRQLDSSAAVTRYFVDALGLDKS